MGTARDFFKLECTNLQTVLEDTLRFKFGLDGSKEFYDECIVRLKFLVGELDALAPDDSDGIKKIIPQLIQLSSLISRIERSSIGEYSWPFVEELKQLAVATCTEETLTNPSEAPKIHVLAEGGLDKYAIFTEANRPSSAGKRILTMVFPRSLKHYVLLHSILGHEVGHAMWQCSKHQKALREAVHENLFVDGAFSNPVEGAKWIYSASAPASVKSQLTFLAGKGLTQANFFSWASWNAWTEEILCDLIGLATFGPAFIGAECSLLCSLDPTGAGLGQRHPPVGVRTNYLLAASSSLGLDSEKYDDLALQADSENMWKSFREKRPADPWFEVFTKDQIRKTCDALKLLFDALPSASFQCPKEADLLHLVKQLDRRIPPNGFEVTTADQMNCRKIDFRHILHAGWIVAAREKGLSFEHVNRLCEHGIMQQRAINLTLSG